MNGNQSCGFNSELFLHTDKKTISIFLINAEKQLHFILNLFVFVIFT